MRSIAVVISLSIFLLIGGCGYTEIEPVNNKQRLLDLHNQARTTGLACGSTKAGSPPLFLPLLKWNNKLADAAEKHSRSMSYRNKLSHQRSTKQRIKSSGYRWRSYAENIAKSQQTTDQTFNMWVNSRAHCKNIINPKFTDIGAAQVNDHWTVLFGEAK